MDDYDSTLNNGTLYKSNMIQASKYNFDSFDPIKELDDKRNFSMIICSKRRTGKSVLLKDICYRMKSWYITAHLFSMTADMQEELYDFFPKKNIHNSFNEEKLQEIWDHQEKLVMRMKASKCKEDDIPNVMIVLDDVISDPKVRKSEILNRYFVAGRHLKFCIIVLSQTFTGVPPVLRTNCDVSVAFYLDSQDNREAYAKQYLSTKNKNLGIMIFEKITREPYTAIVCLNCNTSSNPEETVKVYKAKLKVPKFKVGKNDLKNIYMIDSFIEHEKNKIEIPISRNTKTIKMK